MREYTEDDYKHTKWVDNVYEYKNLMICNKYLAKDAYVLMKQRKCGLLSESDIYSLGIHQSQGWEHYHTFRQEANVLLLRRAKNSC